MVRKAMSMTDRNVTDLFMAFPFPRNGARESEPQKTPPTSHRECPEELYTDPFLPAPISEN
jgi:hypothetical protein